MSKPLDPRLHAFRPDLADLRLKGRIAADRFVEGVLHRVIDPVADLRRAPRGDAGTDTQVLHGDMVRVFDVAEGWAWAQAERDGYVGYLGANALTAGDDPGGTPHRVIAPRTFLYVEPDLKRPVGGWLSMGSTVHVVDTATTRGTAYARLANGLFCASVHLGARSDRASDYVAVAEQLVHVPYLWGGTSGAGVDCSGLVQLAMRMAGRTVLRDTDMQETTIGTAIDPADGLARGDLVFWKGHVGIMCDADRLLHANGTDMAVTIEPLERAITRIAPVYGPPTRYRRPADQ